MERAAAACADRILAELRATGAAEAHIVAGMGNNGGDGLVIARLLHTAGIAVSVARVRHRSEASPDNAANWTALHALGVQAWEVASIDDWTQPHRRAWIVDALFGVGLRAPLTGLCHDLVRAMNASGCPMVAIDLPSGMPAEPTAAWADAPVVKASWTLTLEVPKLGLLLPDHGTNAGEWEIVPIGLDRGFIAGCRAPYRIAELQDAVERLPVRQRFDHKGSFGHALVIAGCEGSMGAAVLATIACCRSGAGLVSAHVPGCGRDVMQAAIPDAMCSVDPEVTQISRLPDLGRCSAVACGPGMGTNAGTSRMLRALLEEWQGPLVLDADALNTIAADDGLRELSRPGWVLTPHPKEFDRLAGRTFQSGHDRLQHARELAALMGCHILLKGAWTAICTPDGEVAFNPTGNPGMAKGGSGDALTGLLAGLLAQRLAPFDACLLGAYAHGLAGDIAAERMGMVGMTASDLVGCLPEAWQRLRSASAQNP